MNAIIQPELPMKIKMKTKTTYENLKSNSAELLLIPFICHKQFKQLLILSN
jgi:hypothetical protein